jgi:serine/threonine protein kinase
VHSIFEITKENKFMGIFSSKKKREPKKPFAYAFLGLKTDLKYKYLYSLEELLEPSLEHLKSKGHVFNRDEVVELMRASVTALSEIHNLHLSHRRIRPSTIYYDKTIKLSSALEPTNPFFDRLFHINYDIINGVMQVPEEIHRLAGASSNLVDVYHLGVTLLWASTPLTWE